MRRWWWCKFDNPTIRRGMILPRAIMMVMLVMMMMMMRMTT